MVSLVIDFIDDVHDVIAANNLPTYLKKKLAKHHPKSIMKIWKKTSFIEFQPHSYKIIQLQTTVALKTKKKYTMLLQNYYIQ